MDDPSPSDFSALPGLLADDLRRRCFAAVVLGASDAEAVAEQTGVRLREVRAALHRLTEAGLLRTGTRLAVDVERLRGWSRAASEAPSVGVTAFPHEPPERARVLAAFVRDRTLTSMPTSVVKLEVVLDHVAQDFEPGVRYLERDVDERLRRWWDDHVALRRLLIDFGQLSRDHGEYWRSGGPV